jgi:hypothetical protein
MRTGLQLYIHKRTLEAVCRPADCKAVAFANVRQACLALLLRLLCCSGRNLQ